MTSRQGFGPERGRSKIRTAVATVRFVAAVHAAGMAGFSGWGLDRSLVRGIAG